MKEKKGWNFFLKVSSIVLAISGILITFLLLYLLGMLSLFWEIFPFLLILLVILLVLFYLCYTKMEETVCNLDWWKKRHFFGEVLPLFLASVFGTFLFIHLCFSFSEMMIGETKINSTHKLIHRISAGNTHNLAWLFAGSIGWYFLYWRTKVADRQAATAERQAAIQEATAERQAATAERQAATADRQAAAQAAIAKRNAKIAEQNIQVTQQRLTDEKLNYAQEQLTNENLLVRLSSVKSLEQIAESQKEERRKIAQTLAIFIRKHATLDSAESRYITQKLRERKSNDAKNIILSEYQAQREDIEAAVTALARIASLLTYREQYNKKKRHLCNLQNTDLRGLRFVEVDLSEFNFAHANLSGAWLRQANLSNTILRGANLTAAYLEESLLKSAFLDFANLSGAHLNGADLSNAYLNRAVLVEAEMGRVRLRETVLMEADLTKAWLDYADFSNVTLKGANLSDASLLHVNGLLQSELKQAFCYRGHIAVVSLSDEFRTLDPPPERDPEEDEDDEW